MHYAQATVALPTPPQECATLRIDSQGTWEIDAK